MKCKYCKEEINMNILGLPYDVCFGCKDAYVADEILKKSDKPKINKP